MKQAFVLTLLWLFTLPLFASWPEYFNSSAKEPENQAQKVIDDLNIKPGDRVADLGAGGGYFTYLMAAKTLHVYAIDTSSRSLAYIKRELQKRKISNVSLIKANARIAIVENDPNKRAFHGHDTDPLEIIDKMKQAGYSLQKRYNYLAHQSYLIFSLEP